MSNFGNGFTDIRDYNIMFDMVERGNGGRRAVIALESIDVFSMPRPATIPPALNWGAGATPFDSPALGWTGTE